MQVSPRQRAALRPYFVADRPKPNGEIDLLCPLHDEKKRSASLNMLTGEFFCFSSCGGMGIDKLMELRKQWVSAEGRNGSGSHRRVNGTHVAPEVITEGKISGWQSALMSSDAELDELMDRRGLNEETLTRFQIGWDVDRKVYTIPIRGFDNEIWNVRRYTFNPKGDTKIWSVAGMRVTELYPVSILAEDPDEIIIGAGEWDVLLAIQNGYPAITRTAGEKTWKPEWNKHFKDRKVWLAHDADFTGRAANRLVHRNVSKVAAETRVIRWPWPITEKHGKDMTDFFLEYPREDFEQLKLIAPEPGNKTVDEEPQVITVLDSFDSHKVAQTVKLLVTIKGKKDPGYSVPKKVHMSCTMDRGAQCNWCPLKGAGGDATMDIVPANPLILEMIDSTRSTLSGILAGNYGVPGAKCPKLTMEIEEYQGVEILFARPSIDHGIYQKDGPDAGAYRNVKITSVGRHDTLPNNTVVATGALYPNPRSQGNEFLAWEIERQETSVDKFEVTPEAVAAMKKFQPTKGQRPLKKLREINDDLSAHVTHIIGRPELHALMDLTFHSVLAFEFGGKMENKGWLQSIALGDTRTGKSDIAVAFIKHFGVGEHVGGEGASLAGLIGGAQQIGGKDWVITWGVIPLNDQRIVVIDEFPHPEDISKMSDALSSGVAKITKIQQDVTLARTRTIWTGNPPQTTMSHFTFGVDALRSVIHTPEDIARFDLAIVAAKGDVASEEINKRIPKGKQKFSRDDCHTMVMWCMTRRAHHIKWAAGAEDEVYRAANEMGKRYIEEPPLIQAANVRIKIARVAVALAARLFSTDSTHEHVVVKKEHVTDAVAFINHLYEMPSFGYAARSRERLNDLQEAEGNRDEIRRFLLSRRDGLPKFLRSTSRFRRQDLEEVLNLDRDQANAVISALWNSRMVYKDGADVKVEPVLHSLLREIN
jgi:MCM P-loop domain